MPKTLLLADDSVTIQKVVGISFANEDVVLLTVDNGDDAIARAREARPDLVLADVMMPGKDGYEVCETLKAEPELRHIPVILLSGTFEPYDDERARRVGADGHITKPFEAEALVDQVNELLARSTASAGAEAAPDETLMVPAAEPAEAEGGFDFFDEEMAQTAPSPSQGRETLTADLDGDLAAEPLELEAVAEEPDGPPDLPAMIGADAGDSQATVAIFDEEPEPAAPEPSREALPFFGEDFDGEALGTSAPTRASAAAAGAPAPAGYEESFDFGFEEEAVAPPRLPATPPPPVPAVAPDAQATVLFEDDAADAVEAGPEPSAAEPEAPVGATPPPLPQPPPVPASARAVSESGSSPSERARELSEPLRRQLQESLEKVAWEAFGDLSERVVREVVERIEAVAWEVIPQMAETLIREEIRRLQGDE
jgi:CheY-like chemotaxis protein